MECEYPAPYPDIWHKFLCCRIERAIVDKDGRIIAVLVGCPANLDWPSVHRSAHAALQAARKRCRFPKKSTKHRRGDFPALSAGISYGGGQKVRHRPSYRLSIVTTPLPSAPRKPTSFQNKRSRIRQTVEPQVVSTDRRVWIQSPSHMGP